MKKHLLLVIFLIPLASFAQIQKGNIFVGGSVGTLLEHEDAVYVNNKEKSFSFIPQIGIVLSPAFAVGLGIGYSTDKSTYTPQGQNTYTASKSWSTTIMPFVRYYIPISETFYFALNGQVSVGYGKVTTDYYGAFDSKSTTAGAAISPMLIYFPSSHWGIQGTLSTLSYSHETLRPEDGDSVSKTSDFDFSAGSVSIGVSYYFNK